MTRALIVVLLVLLGLGALFFALRPDTTASSGEAQEQTFDVSISGGEMEPGELSVTEGDQVNLRITSEEPVEVHLHGYDLEREVEPGEPGEISFEADTSGRFEIEDHETEAVLGTLVVQPR